MKMDDYLHIFAGSEPKDWMRSRMFSDQGLPRERTLLVFSEDIRVSIFFERHPHARRGGEKAVYYATLMFDGRQVCEIPYSWDGGLVLPIARSTIDGVPKAYVKIARIVNYHTEKAASDATYEIAVDGLSRSELAWLPETKATQNTP